MHSKLTSILSVITLFLSLIPTSSFAATTADEYYRQGCDYFEQEKFSQAVKAFEKAIELDTDNATYHYNLGAVYSNLGKYKEALKHLEKAEELAPESQTGKYAKEQIAEIKKYLREVKEQETTEGWHQPNISTKSIGNSEQRDDTIPQRFRYRYKLYQSKIRVMEEIELPYDKRRLELTKEQMRLSAIAGPSWLFQKSSEDFDKLMEDIDKNTKELVEARYKLGLLYLEMGRREMAREQFEKIIHNGWSDEYSVVDKAAEELDKLGSR